MSNLQQERLLLVLAPVAGDVVKQDETAMYLAHIRDAADDGGVVRYTYINVIGITRCVREIIPQHSRVTAFARSGQLQFCQQSISPWIFFTTKNNYCWNDKRPGFYVSVTETDRVGREIVECPGYRKMLISERIESVIGAYKEILARDIGLVVKGRSMRLYVLSKGIPHQLRLMGN